MRVSEEVADMQRMRLQVLDGVTSGGFWQQTLQSRRHSIFSLFFFSFLCSRLLDIISTVRRSSYVGTESRLLCLWVLT